MRSLYGTHSDNVCGYCYYHHAGVTVRQMKRKRCLAKQCPAFRKYTEHGYWKQREEIKKNKRERKAQERGEVK